MATPIRTGFQYVRRAPYQAAAVIAVMAISFFITTLVLIVVYASNNVLQHFVTKPQVIAFLKTDTKIEEQNALESKLKNDSRIKEVSVTTKEEALDIYKNATSDNPLLGELVSPTIFPASIEFSVTEIGFASSVIEDLRKEPFVESVGFTANVGGDSQLGATIDRLKSVTNTIRIAGVVGVIALLSTSFVVLLVVMSMRVSMRRSEVESLSLLGATRNFIRMPILIEAACYALMGTLLGWLSAVLLVLYTSPQIVKYFAQVPVLPKALSELMLVLAIFLGGEVLAAIVIAIVGASIAVSRSLRMLQ